jgi:hypothetical protein
MVVDGHGQGFLGVTLPDAMEIEVLLEFAGLGNRNARRGSFRFSGKFLVQNALA